MLIIALLLFLTAIPVFANDFFDISEESVVVIPTDSSDIVWASKDGNWYLVSNGKCLTGWQLVNNKWYYMDSDGVMLTGWQKVNDIWYYMKDSGAMLTGWQWIDDKWYFLHDSGAMLTGWLLRGQTWYYLESSGAMATGWEKVNGRWYYFDENGAMLTGWQWVDDDWYLLSDSGAMLTGWQKVNNTWYYMNSSGAMLSGWQGIGGSRYYLSPSGAMRTGWQWVDNNWYLLSDSGAMLTGWQKVDGYWYLLGDDGKMWTGWQNINDVWYYLKDSGKMATETCVIDGYPQVFKTNGAWISTAAMDQKANYGSYGSAYKSNTDYLILVNLTDKVTKIYKRYDASWAVEKAWLCTVGDSSKGWTTVTGEFYIGQSSYGNPYTRGPSFDDAEGHTLYYWTRFCDSFLFHSILYDEGTYDVSTYGNALGEELSHGCIRLRTENAEWIYDYIPDNTKVVVYY